MRKRTQLREKLSYANVMSTLCFFLLLGGGAYAASQLPKNSVGPKQLKKNAVRTAKIKNNAVTLKNINLNKLGTVPSANVANTANALAPLEPTHLVGAPGEPAFEGGSSNVSPTGLQVGFYKDHEGIVHLQGAARVGEGLPFPKIFTLPPGYRPAKEAAMETLALCLPIPEPCLKDEPSEDNQLYSIVIIAGSDTNVEGISLSGGVITTPNNAVSLDGITFRAES